MMQWHTVMRLLKAVSLIWSDSYRKNLCRIMGLRLKTLSMQCLMIMQPHKYDIRPIPILPKFNNNGSGGAGLFGVTLSKNAGGIFTITPEVPDRFSLAGDERNEIILKDELFTYNISTFAKTTTPYLYNGQRVVLTKNITLLTPAMPL